MNEIGFQSNKLNGWVYIRKGPKQVMQANTIHCSHATVSASVVANRNSMLAKTQCLGDPKTLR